MRNTKTEINSSDEDEQERRKKYNKKKTLKSQSLMIPSWKQMNKLSVYVQHLHNLNFTFYTGEQGRRAG